MKALIDGRICEVFQSFWTVVVTKMQPANPIIFYQASWIFRFSLELSLWQESLWTQTYPKKNDCSLRFPVKGWNGLRIYVKWLGPGPRGNPVNLCAAKEIAHHPLLTLKFGLPNPAFESCITCKGTWRDEKQNYAAPFWEILNDIPISWNMIQYNTVQSNTIQYDII